MKKTLIVTAIFLLSIMITSFIPVGIVHATEIESEESEAQATEKPKKSKYQLATIWGADDKAITVGFTNQMDIINTEGYSISGGPATVKKWTSSDTSIATIDSEGVITGKKKGTVTITAILATGESLTSKMKVVPNVFKDSKTLERQMELYHSGISITEAYYDKKGNLIVELTAFNNTRKDWVEIYTNFIITSNSYSWLNAYIDSSSGRGAVKPYSKKTITLKFDKSELEKAPVDLVRDRIQIYDHYLELEFFKDYIYSGYKVHYSLNGRYAYPVLKSKVR